jgi:nucleotide-binding universal stress UspA family protein
MAEKMKILVALEFAEKPNEILKMALSVAKKYDAKIFTIHVIEDMPRQSFYYDAYVLWEEFRDKAVKETIMEMSKYIDKLSENFDNIEPIIEVGNPCDKILEVSEKLDVDLIIVGHHVREGLIKHMVHSNICEKVVRFSKRPVLTFYMEEK